MSPVPEALPHHSGQAALASSLAYQRARDLLQQSVAGLRVEGPYRKSYGALGHLRLRKGQGSSLVRVTPESDGNGRAGSRDA